MSERAKDIVHNDDKSEMSFSFFSNYANLGNHISEIILKAHILLSVLHTKPFYWELCVWYVYVHKLILHALS